MLPAGDLFRSPCLGHSKIELPQTAQPPQITTIQWYFQQYVNLEKTFPFFPCPMHNSPLLGLLVAYGADLGQLLHPSAPPPIQVLLAADGAGLDNWFFCLPIYPSNCTSGKTAPLSHPIYHPTPISLCLSVCLHFCRSPHNVHKELVRIIQISVISFEGTAVPLSSLSTQKNWL